MRYLIFAGFDYYPKGGWEDFCGESDDYDDAVKSALMAYDPESVLGKKLDWWHVVDIERKRIVASGKR